MILVWSDPDGDPIAVASESIVGLSILAGAEPAGTVTLVHTVATADRPFLVAAPFKEVLDAWTQARTSGGASGQPGFHGWPVNWWDTLSPPAWKPQGGWPK